MIIARVEHIRQDKICMSGARIFFAEHGLSWSDFLTNGIDAQTLADTGHPLAIKVAQNARAAAEKAS